MQDIAIIQSYLQSGEKFPVPFEEYWQWVGYSRKDVAKRTLENNFIDGADFNLRKTVEVQIEGNRSVKREKEVIFLTTDCAKNLAMLAQTAVGKQVRQYFIDCEKALQKNLPTPMTTAEIVLWNAQRLVDLEKAQLEQAEELKALQESQDATAGKLHHVEAKITNLNNDYYSLAGYYGLRGKKWDLTHPQSQQTGKKLKKISTELGYDTLSVNDARYGAVRTYHVHVLQTVLGF